MSGICAVWMKENPGRLAETLAAASRGLVLTQAESLEQRTDRGAGLAVARRFAPQQIYENERVLVAFDGDLYDGSGAREIAERYERSGQAFIEKLQGSFSIVLWDRRERKLLAAVDGFGINRLVYFEDKKAFLVASRLDALLGAGAPAEVNPRAIINFLNYGVNLLPETIFSKAQRLAPGTMLTASESGIRIERYWDMRYGLGNESDEEKLSRELEQVVEKAVRANCKNDDLTGTGAYLSGGTDSSTVVGMMSRLDRGPVQAFSIGFEEERFNELEYAEITARKFGARHHTYKVSASDCLEALPHMVRYFDEPFANSSAIPTYFCGRLAAQNGVKVLLSGDGGDELFGGNERYRTHKIFQTYQRVPAAVRKGLIEPLLSLVPAETGIFGKARKYVRRSSMPPLERYFSYSFLCAHPLEEIFRRDFLASLNGYSLLEVPARYHREAPAKDDLDQLLYVDIKITLGDSDLPKVTQMSELAGIQTRFPFLDRAVAEFSGRIPAGLKVKGYDKRYLFKRAFRNLLPAEVIKKPKHGFGIPVATWLKTDKRMREFSRDVLFSAKALDRGYFRREFLEDLIRQHEADDTTYYGDNLWSVFVLELWHRQFVDQPLGAAAV
jgi:asparagine synthase (glutamine-hydrolysing)